MYLPRELLHIGNAGRRTTTVFGLPGTGRFLVQGAIDRDYPLVMGMIVVYGALTLMLNLIADLLYGWLDPGARHE